VSSPSGCREAASEWGIACCSCRGQKNATSNFRSRTICANDSAAQMVNAARWTIGSQRTVRCTVRILLPLPEISRSSPTLRFFLVSGEDGFEPSQKKATRLGVLFRGISGVLLISAITQGHYRL